ncbi:MAG: hypothetical protein AAGM40_19215 [Cyanobacteria bacterium J06573_2]
MKRSNLKVLRLLSPFGRRFANAIARNDTNNFVHPLSVGMFSEYSGKTDYFFRSKDYLSSNHS